MRIRIENEYMNNGKKKEEKQLLMESWEIRGRWGGYSEGIKSPIEVLNKLYEYVFEPQEYLPYLSLSVPNRGGIMNIKK